MERNCILPADLVQDVLSRLTVRDLLRLRCVSKEWCALIDNPTFIRKHCQVQHSICKADGNMAHFVYDGGRVMFDLEKFYLLSIRQGDAITLNMSDDLERDSKDALPCGRDLFEVVCFGCVNGIICLGWKDKGAEWKWDFLGLWNPARREFKIVAYPNVPGLIIRTGFQVMGFGFDILSNDFKILGGYCIWRGINESQCYFEVYSLRTNSWKRLKQPPGDGAPLPKTDGYFNGVYYWTLVLEEETGRHLTILSFNFGTEAFKASNPPEDAASLVFGRCAFESMITLYKESLGLLISHETQEKPALYKIDIWVVTRFDDGGGPLSWQHLFTVGPTFAKLGLQVATTLVDGVLLLTFLFPSEESTTPCDSYEDGECCLSNPSTGECKKLEIDYSTIYRYVESLFPLSRRLVQS